MKETGCGSACNPPPAHGRRSTSIPARPMTAGEEPGPCGRLRLGGGKIARLDAEMTRHDAAMTRCRQWWRRSVRAGHAYAEGAWLHRAGPIRHWRREVRSNWFWGLLLPII